MQVLNLQGVLPEAGGIGRIGKQPIVVADLKHTQPQKTVAFRQSVQVKQQLLSGVLVFALTKVKRVLLTFFRLREVKIPAQSIRHTEVGLLNAGQHLLIELLLKSLGRLQDGFGIRVFGFQMLNDLGVLFFAKPEIVVQTDVSVDSVLNGLSGSDRRLRTGRPPCGLSARLRWCARAPT